MSSYYGGGFDEWLEDSFLGSIPADKWAAIRAIMEPHRESIECTLDGYDPDEHSWRDYRNSMWYSYEIESAKIKTILDGTLRPEIATRTPEQEYGHLVSGAP